VARCAPPTSNVLFRFSGPRAQILLGNLQIADDHGEQIVEIVSDPTGELADGLQLLRLP
jgi:hypothetical protein